ncbi:DUF1499 domain-containing protein [Alcanivorax sp.]|jgi:uncharacterized protein (DUF1499 family)|uniref:DUF1499 domain-containing protein n=1 Tax=Alcanivorax sp. TaxID=1872427 RepID=UPI000C4DFD50|nr:DUF1499 domain-containing protein [Alcanivorax sp.]MBQ25206.1 hypothetical protein [Alcanivorax sp.]|tara:strand:- start:643 stop:1059 length:417 start_codon:yes stop_codon:yes gene_type:complete
MADTHLLAPCPDSPNCVSSLATQADKRVAPLQVGADRPSSLKKLESLLGNLPRVDYEVVGQSRIQARFTSRVLRFVDDVTFYVRDNGVVEVRSASRTGYWDLGANRRRVESLREQLSEQDTDDRTSQQHAFGNAEHRA